MGRWLSAMRIIQAFQKGIQMGMKSKRKGASGELEVAALWQIYGWTEAHRGRQYSGGPESPDVVVSPEIDGLLHCEVKRTERFNLDQAIEQACEDCGEEQTWVVFHRKNAKRWVVIIDAEVFLSMARMIWSRGLWSSLIEIIRPILSGSKAYKK